MHSICLAPAISFNFLPTIEVKPVTKTTFMIISVVAIVFIIIRKLCFGGSSVDGWASLVCIMAFIGGLQLACLGIIGQYLSKTYMEVKRRPHYIVRETNDDSVDKIR